jgi:hypothetical protein
MKQTFKSEIKFNELISDEPDIQEIEKLREENQDLRSVLEDSSEFENLQNLFQSI